MSIPKRICIFVCLALLLIWWQRLPDRSSIQSYFSTPLSVLRYLSSDAWSDLAGPALRCFATSLIALGLAGLLALGLLAVGAATPGGLRQVERFAAFSQTVPVLVLVTLSLITQRELAGALGLQPSAMAYCLAPVTLALVFPPLVAGAESIARASIEMKSLLRLWSVSRWHRVRWVYLPIALPQLLVGLRTSGTWAVGATLVTEALVIGVPGDSRTLGHLVIRVSAQGAADKGATAMLVATALAYGVYATAAWVQRRAELRFLGRTLGYHYEYPLHAR